MGSYGYQPYYGRQYWSPYGNVLSPWSYMYGRYGYYGYNSYYNPWYGGYYGYGYGGYSPTVLVVSRRTNDNRGGRAIAGRGYSSGRSSPPSASQGYRPPRSSGGASSSADGQASQRRWERSVLGWHRQQDEHLPNLRCADGPAAGRRVLSRTLPQGGAVVL